MMGNLGGKLCLNLLVSVNRLVSIPIDYIHRLPSLSPQKLFLSLGEMGKNRKKLVPELSPFHNVEPPGKMSNIETKQNLLWSRGTIRGGGN